MLSLLILVLALLLCTSNATWFPEMSMTTEQWSAAMTNYDITSTYKTCNTITASREPGQHYHALYNDKPTTIVFTGQGDGNMDIKFKDSLYIFDQEIQLTQEYPCLVIPPYQPVEWLMINMRDPVSICSYEGSTKEKGSHASDCVCNQVLERNPKCKAVRFPRTIRKPEHEFFLTAEVIPKANDITICTILTVDRLLRVSQTSNFWDGPISAAVYLHDLSEVSVLMEWWLSNSTMRRNVDIHLVYDDKIVAFALPDRPFPVNILRNVAIRYARTANVLYLEADFIPSPDLYPSLDKVRDRLARGEKSVFIVAPFSTDKADFDMANFPKNKAELEKVVHSQNSLIRDLSYYNSHHAFDFNGWFKKTEIYSMYFSAGYEPYYVGPKSYPLFEEIFIGCGADKVSHPGELHAAGYAFSVLPQGFVIHIDSTGMGSAWCRGWAGNQRSSLKMEAFNLKTSHIYGGNAKKMGSFDSRIPWWDLSPVNYQLQITGGQLSKPEEVCVQPPEKECPECKTCEVCKECESCPPCEKVECPPPTASQCKRFIEPAANEVAYVKSSLQLVETEKTKLQKDNADLAEKVELLQLENERLQNYSKFVANVSVGSVVVLAALVGVWACVWPKGKRVFVLPTWKSTHHNL